MKALDWLNDAEFVLEGVRFRCDVGDYTGKTDSHRFVLLKDRAVLEQYARVLGESPPKHILEFGIFQGGSAALYALWFDADRFVGVDISDPVPGLEEFRRRHPAGARIRCHYGVSQTDRGRIERIAREEFGATPIDLIIDDASHRYADSRRTFEIAFPLLRPGGVYVVEDWGWAHWQERHAYYDRQTALSMLVMELLMACASRPDVISEVRVFPSFAFIRKSVDAGPMSDLRLESLYRMRGIVLAGPDRLPLAGLGRIAAEHVGQRVRRRLERTRAKARRAARKLSKAPQSVG